MNHEVKKLLELKNRQLFSLSEQQALEVLKMPIESLCIWVREQIEMNPLLELDPEPDVFFSLEKKDDETPQEIDFEKSSFEVLHTLDETFHKSLFPSSSFERKKTLEDLPSSETLFEYLMAQARQTLDTQQELQMAETIIGNLDERGFLTTPLYELFEDESASKAVLKKIQTFDPPGIGAETLKASFLLQLEAQGEKKTVAYQMIDYHFDDLVHHRYKKIMSHLSLNQEQLKKIIEKLSLLKPNPTSKWYKIASCPIVPDLYLRFDNETWYIEINEELLPSFRFSTFYHDLLAKTEKGYLKKQLKAGKWVQEVISRRGETLTHIAHFLLKHQEPFLQGLTKELIPISLKDLSKELSLHISTITRAVGGKYLFCPAGLFPLRYFFTYAVSTKGGDKVSQRTLKNSLQKIIDEEDKTAPLSDDALSKQLQREGFCCARRTITKYRKQLRLPSAHQRRSVLSR